MPITRPAEPDSAQQVFHRKDGGAELFALTIEAIRRRVPGCRVGDEVVAALAELNALPRLEIHGLMTMAPFFENPQDARPAFRALRELRDRLQEQHGIPLPALSMGMTNDFEIAIEEGATLVRIGTAIFRPASGD